ncbi:hydrogenase maturation nickel metallochaperone HypA [Oscillatoriales cyanobacterium USR001]|nr:hydrogenase maturation nickel metallochaperone HypA [Oscillatoriales cyanobacterium USR001]
MHELGITQNIVAIAIENAQGNEVKKVTIEIGKLSAIMPDAVQFCFSVCREGTLLKSAILEIIEIPGKGKCRQCGAEVTLDVPFGICKCGSIELDLISGQELKIKEMEI